MFSLAYGYREGRDHQAAKLRVPQLEGLKATIELTRPVRERLPGTCP